MIYAVGDVHGESEALREMLALLPVQESDIVLFLGDLINRRGRNPYDCVEQVIAFDLCHKICLNGNHEEAMQFYLEAGYETAMDGMDAGNTFSSYEDAGYPIRPGNPTSIPDSHLRYYFQAETWTLPFYITDKYIFTHAGWNLYKQVKEQNAHNLRWGTVTGFEAPVMPQTVIKGHTPMPKVTFSAAKHYIGVDTGCGLGGFLSAIALPSEEIFTVKPASYNPRWYQNLRR